MILKLFTQQNCTKSPAAKQLVKDIEHKVQAEYHDLGTVNGLAEALYYNILLTPSIIMLNHDNEIIGHWNGEVPTLEMINKIIK